jgi:hypothetical protein
MNLDKLQDEESERMPQLPSDRRPFWTTAAVLLGFIMLLVGGAFVLNARLRPRVGTDVATVAPSAITSIATPTVGLAQVASSSVTTGTLILAPSSTAITPDVRAAVTQAYLRYWDVYNAALLTLDSSHLSDAMAGDELARAQQSVDQLRSANQALKSDVSHHYEITSIAPDAATLDDNFVDRSYVIDATTKQPLGTPEPSTTESISCRLELTGGVWKVVRVVKVNVTVVNQ